MLEALLNLNHSYEIVFIRGSLKKGLFGFFDGSGNVGMLEIFQIDRRGKKKSDFGVFAERTSCEINY